MRIRQIYVIMWNSVKIGNQLPPLVRNTLRVNHIHLTTTEVSPVDINTTHGPTSPELRRFKKMFDKCQVIFYMRRHSETLTFLFSSLLLENFVTEHTFHAYMDGYKKRSLFQKRQRLIFSSFNEGRYNSNDLNLPNRNIWGLSRQKYFGWHFIKEKNQDLSRQ